MVITRRKSRIKAVIALYQCDLLKKNISEIIQTEIIFKKNLDGFTIKLALGVENNKKLIDDIIKKVVENWTIERISIIDRNIIRVAIYEMFFEKDIPLKVSVDEAIEIAKLLGQKKDTPKFVNGILGKIITDIDNIKEALF